MTGIEWREPPPSNKRAATKWGEVAVALRERPGAWAYLGTFKSPNTAHYLRRYTSAFTPGDFEVRSHRAEGGFEVFARYIGSAS